MGAIIIAFFWDTLYYFSTWRTRFSIKEILTKCRDPRLNDEDRCAGHHPGVVVVVARAGGQRSSCLGIGISDTDRLLTVIFLAEEDVALQVNRVGVREPAGINSLTDIEKRKTCLLLYSKVYKIAII